MTSNRSASTLALISAPSAVQSSVLLLTADSATIVQAKKAGFRNSAQELATVDFATSRPSAPALCSQRVPYVQTTRLSAGRRVSTSIAAACRDARHWHETYELPAHTTSGKPRSATFLSQKVFVGMKITTLNTTITAARLPSYRFDALAPRCSCHCASASPDSMTIAPVALFPT